MAAVADFTPAAAYKDSLFLPSQLSSLSTTPHSNTRISHTIRLLSRPRRVNAKVLCSVAPNQLQTPVAPQNTSTPNNKGECYGVFCLTYDLKAVEETKSWKSLINIAVSGAAGMISNHLLFKLASGEVFGQDQPIALKLLGSERSFEALEGVAMELEDSLFPLLREVSISIDPYDVFRDVEWALLIGAKPRGPGMERADLLDINGQIFVTMSVSMGAEFDAFLFKETINQDMIIPSWLDDANGVYTTPNFSQELQDLEDHLFNFEADTISSLPVPFETLFLLDPCSLDTSTQPQPNGNYPSVVPVEQPEPDVCDTFLNDYEFYGMISPNDLSPADGEYDSTTTVHNYSEQPMIINEAEAQDESNDEDGSDSELDTKKQRGGRLNSKNLVSERNRRKRLSHQLLSLRSLVPNITKMDKRSVLVDALSYLTNIHQESEKLEKELKQQQQPQDTHKLNELKESSSDNPCGALRVPPRRCSAPTVLPIVPRLKPVITEIDAEKIEEKRFIVKITCKGSGSGSGGGNDVVRVIESLDFEITYTALQQLQPQEILITVFIRVRKQGKMTEEKLKRWITTMALKAGLTFQEDP